MRHLQPGDRHSMEYGRDNNMSKLPIRPRVTHHGSGGTKDAADSTNQWLQDAPVASADALNALGYGSNSGGGDASPFEWPTNGKQLADCLNAAAAESRDRITSAATTTISACSS